MISWYNLLSLLALLLAALVLTMITFDPIERGMLVRQIHVTWDRWQQWRRWRKERPNPIKEVRTTRDWAHYQERYNKWLTRRPM